MTGARSTRRETPPIPLVRAVLAAAVANPEADLSSVRVAAISAIYSKACSAAERGRAEAAFPASGVAVDIPLLAAIHPGDPPDAGVLPDVRVAPSFADAAAGRDTEMQAAFALIARWQGRAVRP